MFFNSLDFAIFFPIIFILYWIVSKHITTRNLLIIVASYVFYGWWDWRFLILIVISSLVDFIVGQKIHHTQSKKKRKYFLLISLLVNLGFLAYFKYTNFFIETFIDSFRLFGRELEVSTLNIILPVGISFYTFQTLSYTIDIYRKQLKPTKDWISFFAFVAFFPQLVAGPIERASHLLPQFFKQHKFNYEQVKSGLLLIAFGLFKKMVIADRAAILVNQVYNNPTDYYGYEMVIATVLFAFQIYCDFSGYTDIAIGTARTMGFDIMKNFDSPYFSKSITEFWRRWHISLSTWFRDYVYIPLGGSRKGEYKTYANLFIVFVVSGLWHGAAITFVVWGAIHGVFIVIEKALTRLRKKVFTAKRQFLNYVFAIPFTFFIVCFAWVFFRANSFSDALLIIQNSLNFNSKPFLWDNMYINNFDERELWVLFTAILALSLKDFIDRNDTWIIKLNQTNFTIRWAVYLILALSIIFYGQYGDDSPAEFIYFQF
jgi:alginate O-acetyltransferase complex protein AlgI